MRLKFFSSVLCMTLLGWAGGAPSLHAMTAAELQKQLAAGEKLTVIDVRLPALFTRAHIPGAINIPASVCAGKKLPPLGKVVVCGDGLGSAEVEAAAAALGAKPGISPVILEGGFTAWETSKGQTSQPRGTQPEALRHISYAELKALKPGEAVLVDLRAQSVPAAGTQRRGAPAPAPGSGVSRPAPQAISRQAPPADPPLTDLGVAFPGFRTTRSPFETSPRRAMSAGETPPLLVLIDRGDGAAQQMARTLQANGITRYAILAGGELALERQGKSGSQRGNAGSAPGNVLTPVPQPAN